MGGVKGKWEGFRSVVLFLRENISGMRCYFIDLIIETPINRRSIPIRLGELKLGAC